MDAPTASPVASTPVRQFWPAPLVFVAFSATLGVVLDRYLHVDLRASAILVLGSVFLWLVAYRRNAPRPALLFLAAAFVGCGMAHHHLSARRILADDVTVWRTRNRVPSGSSASWRPSRAWSSTTMIRWRPFPARIACVSSCRQRPMVRRATAGRFRASCRYRCRRPRTIASCSCQATSLHTGRSRAHTGQTFTPGFSGQPERLRLCRHAARSGHSHGAERAAACRGADR